MANTVEQFGSELKRKMAGIDYSPIFPAISAVADRSIQQNFQVGGRWGIMDLFGGGSAKWKQSSRVSGERSKNKKYGQVLVDSGQLSNSIEVRVKQEGSKIVIEAGSNKRYAAVYQFGFNDYVTVRGHTRRTKKGESYNVKGFSRRMIVDRRPFVVLQKEDIEEIKMIIAKHMIKVTGTW